MIIKQGQTFRLRIGCTGQGKNTSGNVPVRLRIKTPCCQRECRPDYELVNYGMRVNGSVPLVCPGCKWRWRLISLLDQGDKISVVVVA
jgi:hypothetical protein